MFTILRFNNLFFSTVNLVNLVLSSMPKKKKTKHYSSGFLCHDQHFYYFVKYLFEVHLKILWSLPVGWEERCTVFIISQGQLLPLPVSYFFNLVSLINNKAEIFLYLTLQKPITREKSFLFTSCKIWDICKFAYIKLISLFFFPIKIIL